MYFPFDPAIQLLGIYPIDLPAQEQTDERTRLLIVALL